MRPYVVNVLMRVMATSEQDAVERTADAMKLYDVATETTDGDADIWHIAIEERAA